MTSLIRQWRLGAFALVALVVLTACSSVQTVINTSAPDFSVANFQTFGVMQPLSTDQGQYPHADQHAPDRGDDPRAGDVRAEESR